jgi:hypothetical protein
LPQPISCQLLIVDDKNTDSQGFLFSISPAKPKLVDFEASEDMVFSWRAVYPPRLNAAMVFRSRA